MFRANRWKTPPLIWHTLLRANARMETDGAASPLSDLLCSREILRKINDLVWAGTLVIQMRTVSLSFPPPFDSSHGWYKSQSLELMPAFLLIETVDAHTTFKRHLFFFCQNVNFSLYFIKLTVQGEDIEH